MFCPHCGNFDEGNPNYCSNCGSVLNFFPAAVPVKHKSKPIKFVVVAVVLMLMTVAVLGSIPYDDVEPKDTQPAEGDAYFDLTGDFLVERDILSVGFNKLGQMEFVLKDETASEYSFFDWTFLDLNHSKMIQPNRSLRWQDNYREYTGTLVSKNEPVLYYTDPKAGDFEITVKCYTGDEGDYKLIKTYSGKVTYINDIEKEYVWEYLGEEYSISFTLGFNDYREYRDLNKKGRSSVPYSNITSFVTYEDSTITSLAESLRSAYGKEIKQDQDFAAFVLSFVQICFGYPPYNWEITADRYLYGNDEHFAYPLETIFHGMGDCEDTSFLAASLFKALGYDAGIVLLPGHAIAAVGLDEYDPGVFSESKYEVLSKNIGSTTFYGCETTTDSFLQIGLVNSDGYEDEPYSYYIDKDRNGFYIV